MNDTKDTPDTNSQVNLSVFADDRWFKDKSKSRFWLRIYTLLGVGKDEADTKLKNRVQDLEYGIPARIWYGYLGETEWPIWTQHLICGETAIPEIQLEQGKKKFPGSMSVIISMPFNVDGKQIAPEKITKALSVIPSIMAAHLGKNTLRDIIFDGAIAAHDGSFDKIGTVTNIPKPSEGPHLLEILWQTFQDTVQAMDVCKPEERERFELAIEFFERGIEEYNKDTRRSEAFLFYWMAMEILCGGESRNVEISLKNYYHLKDRQEVQTILGTKAICGWRNKMVHEGKRPSVTPDVERFMQLLFTDLLRYKLGLKPIGLALSYSTSGGVDLSPIGLQNRRGANDRYTLVVQNLGNDGSNKNR